MDEDILAGYLALFHAENFGPALLSQLVRKFGTLKSLQLQSDQQLIAIGLKSKQLQTLRGVSDRALSGLPLKDVSWANETAHHILYYESADYPPRLREIHTAPPLLYLIGGIKCLSEPMLAIVGSRKASAYGARNAYWMAMELGSSGIGISSGLALGVDAKAHQGALDSGIGTVAVMGTGADRVYPLKNRKLAERIACEGALISEFPLGTKPLPYNFPQRNRIISGLSLGTLVVEATEKSGSLITAKYALDQNREVFAFPGAIDSQQSRGCHALIKQGAKLVEEPGDILEELGYMIREQGGQGKKDGSQAASKTEKLVIKSIEQQGSLLDGLLKSTGIEYQALSQLLLQLEVDGKIHSQQGRYFKSGY